MRALTICIIAFFIQQANADITIHIVESGGDVQATLSGNLNLAATQGFISDSTGFDGILPQGGNVSFTSDNSDYYGVDFGTWTPLGSGAVLMYWDSSSGDAWHMFSNPVIGVPVGYVSGNALAASATMTGSSFATLGLTPGIYVTTLTNGQVTDTVTVNIGSVAPPIPPTAPVPTLEIWAMIALSFLLAIFGMRFHAFRRN